MDANMVTVHVVGWMLFGCGIESESDALLQFTEKAISSPAVTEKEELQPSAFTMFAQDIGVAKQFGDPLDDRQNLIPQDKRVQASAEIRFGGKAAGYSQRETGLRLSAHDAGERGQANVVDFRIRTPDAASGN